MLSLSIDTRSPTPIYEQIMAQVREAVSAGVLKAGAGLPPVRQLAAELEVNPNTVAKAYQILERDGILRSVRRRGCFVAEGAAEGLRRRSGRELEATLDRVLAEGERMGIRGEDFLAALTRRLAQREPPAPTDTGR
jgi:GntR family transcriptional regulator